MAVYLLDTNHVGLAVDSASLLGQRVAEARLAGIRLGTCLPVLCEIEAGLRQVRRKVKYRRDLDHLLLQLRLWPMRVGVGMGVSLPSCGRRNVSCRTTSYSSESVTVVVARAMT